MDLVIVREAPPNRQNRHDGPAEVHMPEGAVMLAVAEWLFEAGAVEVKVHPDGQHMSGFDMPRWLESRGFLRVSRTGKSGIAGEFRRGAQVAVIHSRPGLGDVVAEINGTPIEVEAKGGCINTRHPGQLSKLRKGLCEAIGQLMASPRKGCRLIAVVPYHSETENLGRRLLERSRAVGIEIALANPDGSVVLI